MNQYFTFFDGILLIDNSIDNEIYQKIVQIDETGVDIMCSYIPDYIEHRLPLIYGLIKGKN